MYRAVEKYVVRLTAEERVELEAMIRQRRIAADKQLRAKLLLHADEGEWGPAYLDQQLVEEFGVSRSKVTRLRRQLVLEGFRAALSRRTCTQPRRRKLDGEQEARLVTLACSAPPAGRARWTLQMLADQLVELKVVDSISKDCVRDTLKKTTLSHGGVSSG
jgi:transposase